MSETRIRKIIGPVMAVLVGLAGAAVGYYFLRGPATPARPARAAAQLAGITSVAVDRGDVLYAGGTFGVKVFGPDWQVTRQWATRLPVTALAVGGDGSVYVAYRTKVEKFDAAGKSLLLWGRGGCEGDDFGYVSGIAVSRVSGIAVSRVSGPAVGAGSVFVCDAGKQVVYRFSEDGRPLGEIGSADQVPDGEGIRAPSACVDCVVGDKVVYINNPGHTRVETYTFDGKRVAQWGKGGTKDDEFPGCCNPTNVARLPDGRFVVSQKGDPCLKIFSADGAFLMVLGRDVFDKDCIGIDLAVDSASRVYAVDRIAGCVRVFGVP